jgi:2'-5' RNA ligase
MRLFIALELPVELQNYIFFLQKNLYSEGLRIVNSTHLTLKFLGEFDESMLPTLVQKLDNINFRPFALSTTEIGVFPNSTYIRVIWLGIQDNRKLTDLHLSIENALGAFKKDFEFHPHITLARVSFVKDKERLLQSISLIKTQPMSFNIDKFVLFKSVLSPSGPIYSPIKEFKVS